MRTIYHVLFTLLGLFWGRELFTDFFPYQEKLLDFHVLDGDTVQAQTASGQLRVRLLGIDAPELGQPTRLAHRDAGLYSKQCLQQMMSQKKGWILKWGTRDIYGRILGELISGKQQVARLMIQAGCASFYPWAKFFTPQDRKRLWSDYVAARWRRVGLWAQGGYLRPYYWRKLKKLESKTKTGGHRDNFRAKNFVGGGKDTYKR